MGSLISVNQVGYRYGRAQLVLDDVSVDFVEGQVHAIIGPSGCGKSTLLYLIGLMLRPESGEIVVVGAELTHARDFDRAIHRSEYIGFVFQDSLLEPSMTVMENVIEGIPLQHRVSEYQPDIDSHLLRLGVADLRDRKASQLSGGQAQRVALVRAMVKRPMVLLADEPTGNLDGATASIVLSELFNYGRQPGHTCIVVTHDERITADADTVLRLEPINV
ncbi:MAG: ATP-binding cassette domain-containing protein [Ilumatobacteraceae bacterium]